MSNPHKPSRPREKIRLEPVTPALLEEVVRRIVAAVDPDRIILVFWPEKVRRRL